MLFNPHPPLTGFPIVLMSVLVASELFAIVFKAHREKAQNFARIVLLIVCALAPLTYYSGYWGAEHASGSFKIADELISDHQVLGRLFMLSLVPVTLLSLLDLSREVSCDTKRENKNSFSPIKISYLFFLLLSFFFVILASRQGGILVFDHGAGVVLDLVRR